MCVLDSKGEIVPGLVLVESSDNSQEAVLDDAIVAAAARVQRAASAFAFSFTAGSFDRTLIQGHDATLALFAVGLHVSFLFALCGGPAC